HADRDRGRHPGPHSRRAAGLQRPGEGEHGQDRRAAEKDLSRAPARPQVENREVAQGLASPPRPSTSA
ncbi:MAG TPA: hypothetical protein VFM29_01310, partial [Vicinamibacteria bacterium]|nr:hypothetical protein [Vicinamibacteria bacterium]